MTYKGVQLAGKPLVGVLLSLSVMGGCVAGPQPQEGWSADVQACAAIFDTSEEELGLTPDADVAVGQRNFANWIEGMLGNADDAMLRSYALAAAGASRAAAAKYEERGFLGPEDGEILITALLKVELRCKQVMGIAE